jgi:hypothetical protein
MESHSRRWSCHDTINETKKFVKFGHIELVYSREVIYVQDFLDDFRQFEFD